MRGWRLWLAMAAVVWAQPDIRRPRKTEAPTARVSSPTLRVTTQLVLVPVTVTDQLNRPVVGLEREHFRVFEDKVEQQIAAFSTEDAPTALGMVFDTSGSMGEKLRRSRAAAKEFFKFADTEDEFFLVEFNSRPQLVVPLTRDTGEIEHELLFSRSKGSTAMLDAIYLAMNEMRKSKKSKKALLVISDGGDNSSRYTVSELNRVVREADVLIYGIGVYGGGNSREEYDGPALLSKITDATGGRTFTADARELPDIARKIGVDLRNRYLLAYAPTNTVRDGKYRHIGLKLVPPRGLPKLTAHWRTGYYAPTE
jgi:VWFA-related protein